MTAVTPSSVSPALLEVLERSRELGFLGPGPLQQQVVHALGFANAAQARLGMSPPASVLDLGSGGGLPGLLLVDRWVNAKIVLLDANERRTSFLEEAIAHLAWSERVSVVRERAEVAGRDPLLRGLFDVVVARSFGPPAVTAECGAPFLRVGGVLVVSEPPEAGDQSDPGAGEVGRDPVRWPPAGLLLVGLKSAGEWRERFGYQVLRQAHLCPDRYPRRVGIPTKRPIYRSPDPKA